MNKLPGLILMSVCSLSMVSGRLEAATFGFHDPRSLAMGGTGVSQANIDHAAYFNPALLSVAQEDDDFSLLAPAIGVQAYDPENLKDDIEAYQDGKYETTFKNNVDRFNSATPAEQQVIAQDIATSGQQLLDSLNAMSGKELDFEVNAALGVAVPGKSLGLAVSANGRVMGGAVLNVHEEDNNLMQQYIDAANDYADNGVIDNPGAYPLAYDGTNFFSTEGRLQSTATLRGAMVLEGGLSLSHEFESLGGLAIGVTPKVIEVTTFDYQIGVENAELDEDAIDKGKLKYKDNNFDIGLAKSLGESWKAGLVIKNALKKEYQTVLGNTIVLEPMARAGLSHHTNWTTIALDLDLTENDRTGLTSEKTRYAAFGMEFDISLFQFRVGARRNLSAEEGRARDMLSAGLGIYLAGFHADLAVAKNDDEAAAALQLGIQF